MPDHLLSLKQNAECNQEQTPSMASSETIAQETKRTQNSARRLAILSTVVYIILFFPLFYMGLFSSMIFDNPHMTIAIGLSIMFFIFLVPLSIPVSIYLIWSRYLRGQYQKTCLFCALPIFTFIGVSLIVEALRALLRYLVP